MSGSSATGQGTRPRLELAIERIGSSGAVEAAALCARSMSDPWSASAIRGDLAQPGAELRCARAADGVAGVLLTRQVLDIVSLRVIAVDPSHRRRGVARRLVESWRGDATGVAAVQLEVRASNEAAIRFYEGLGFETVGRRPRYYRGGEDALLMTWRPA